MVFMCCLLSVDRIIKHFKGCEEWIVVNEFANQTSVSCSRSMLLNIYMCERLLLQSLPQNILVRLISFKLF